MSKTDDLLKEVLEFLEAQCGSEADNLKERLRLQVKNTASIVWDIGDVKSLKPEMSDANARHVLDVTLKYHDCNNGITWDSFKDTIIWDTFDENI